VRPNPALAPGGRFALLRKPFICAPARAAARLRTAPPAGESPAGEARIVIRHQQRHDPVGARTARQPRASFRAPASAKGFRARAAQHFVPQATAAFPGTQGPGHQCWCPRGPRASTSRSGGGAFGPRPGIALRGIPGSRAHKAPACPRAAAAVARVSMRRTGGGAALTPPTSVPSNSALQQTGARAAGLRATAGAVAPDKEGAFVYGYQVARS